MPVAPISRSQASAYVVMARKVIGPLIICLCVRLCACVCVCTHEWLLVQMCHLETLKNQCVSNTFRF